MRRWSIALFRLFGIELEVHATFLLLLALVGWLGWSHSGWNGAQWSLVYVGLVFVCVVLHELGHSLVARRFGVQVPRIVLLPIGGMAQFDRIPREPGRELAIALAGPAVNWVIVLALLAWSDATLAFISPRPGLWSDLPAALLSANLMLGTFNLLPAFPMDGGRVLRALLALKLRYVDATAWAARAGQIIAIGGFVVSARYNQPLYALLFTFVFIAAQWELEDVRRQDLYSGLKVGDVVRSDFAGLPAESPLSAAYARLKQIQPQDLLLFTNGVPSGILLRERLIRAIREKRDAERCDQHSEPDFEILQDASPLVPDATDLIRSGQSLFPVYRNGEFIGVLDTRHLDAIARLQKREIARRW